MANKEPNLLMHLHVLLNHSIAPTILGCLRDSQRESVDGIRFVEVCNRLKKPREEWRHASETLDALEKAGLVERKKSDGYDLLCITIEGLRALEEFGRLSQNQELGSLPEPVRELMRRHGYTFLLPAQREFLKLHFPLPRNMIVIAPPSAGKTFLAECCVLDELQKGGKVLYITPYKALNRQKYELFTKYFREYDVVRTDGDTFPTIRRILKARLIVATYEKALMSVLRDEQWLQNLSPIVADEITLLNDPDRGHSLDLLLSILKNRCRILTLSSHIGNIKVIKKWLKADSYEAPPDEIMEEYIVRKIGPSVKIENRTGSWKDNYPRTSAIKAVVKHSKLEKDRTMIVLVGERRIAERLASQISKSFPSRKERFDRLIIPDEETSILHRLNKALKHGVAFHHAGLPFDIRENVEDLLDKRNINIVVSTPTLSHGVDFPLDHVVIDWDSFGGDRLKKIEYMQYKGRAARIGKSRGGNVYVFSQGQQEVENRIRQFLSKPVEDVFPPHLDIDHLEWIVLLSCRQAAAQTAKAIKTHAKDLLKNLLVFRSPAFRTTDRELNQVLNMALKRLKEMGLLSVKRNKIVSTNVGKIVSKVDWVPHDSYQVLRDVEKLSSEDPGKIAAGLLFAVTGIGLLKRFDSSRVTNIVLVYVDNIRKEGRELPPKNLVRGLALSSILLQWINEVPIEGILRQSTTGNIVHDEDIRKLGNYASVEMRKIALVSEDLGYKKVAQVANALIGRLKRGVKDDLVSKEPATDLSWLECIGRRRSRLLYNLGFKNLLDIYSLVFSQGEQAFVKKSELPKELASKTIEQLRRLVQTDQTLSDLCKEL